MIYDLMIISQVTFYTIKVIEADEPELALFFHNIHNNTPEDEIELFVWQHLFVSHFDDSDDDEIMKDKKYTISG